MDKCLLLVDAEQNVIRAIRRMCRRSEIRVVDTASGEEALALAAEHQPGVVLVDQRLSGMSGIELLQQMKDHHPEILRMMISAHSDLNQLADAVNNGAIFKFILKPWDDEQLISILDEAFYISDLDRHNQQLTNELQALNRDLEKRVEEKTRSLQLHVRSLNVTREIFNVLPYFAIGISEDGLIVDANLHAMQALECEALVGMPESMLPAELREAFSKWKGSDNKQAEFHPDHAIQIGEMKYVTCFSRFETSGGAKGYLLSGYADD